MPATAGYTASHRDELFCKRVRRERRPFWFGQRFVDVRERCDEYALCDTGRFARVSL